jgi:STE24 endopeptidase
MPLPLIVLGAYLFVVFGFLSRMCERQADLFGCRAVSCGNPHCEGHDETTVYEPSTGRLCPTSVRTFTTALERVTGANAMEPLRLAGLAGVLAWLWAWIRAWQHGPVASRVGFLFRALDEPDLAVRFQRFSVMVRIAMIVVLVLAAIALTATIGWQRLLN